MVEEKRGRGNGWGAHTSFSKQLVESTGTPPSFSHNWKVLIAGVWRLDRLEFCQVCFLEALSMYLLRENTQNNMIYTERKLNRFSNIALKWLPENSQHEGLVIQRSGVSSRREAEGEWEISSLGKMGALLH